MPRHHQTARRDNNQTTKYMDGTIITIISLAVVSSASIALNFGFFAEARHKDKECNDFIKDAALLEKQLADTKAELANEKMHREWAIGRIKDQDALIKGLSHALKSASKDRYKQWLEKDGQRKEDGNERP